MVKEGQAITAATRNVPLADFSVLLAAWRGDHETTAALAAAAIDAGTPRDEGFAVEVGEWAMAVLHNGLGEHAKALAAAERATSGRDSASPCGYCQSSSKRQRAAATDLPQ